MSRWLTIRTPAGFNVWDLGAVRDEVELQDLVTRARIMVAFPAGDGWISDPARLHTVQLGPGQPHESLMAQATLRLRVDLAGIDPAAVTAYRGESAAAERQARLSAARLSMTALTTEERAVIVGEYSGPRPTVSRT